VFFFSSRRRHTRWPRDWSSDVCSSDLHLIPGRNFAITYRSSHPAPGDDPKEIALEKEEVEKAFASDPDANSHAQLYFSLYFAMKIGRASCREKCRCGGQRNR